MQYTFSKSSTGGVWILNGVAQCIYNVNRSSFTQQNSCSSSHYVALWLYGDYHYDNIVTIIKSNIAHTALGVNYLGADEEIWFLDT